MAVLSHFGPAYLLKGLSLLTTPGLRSFVIAPLAINTLLFSFGIYYGWQQFELFLAEFQSWVPSWLSWLEWLLIPIFVISALLVVFFTFSLIANIIAAPFNGLLAEKTERHLRGRPLDDHDDGKSFVAGILPAILDEIGKQVHVILVSIPFLILFLIPGVNLIAPFLWALATAWLLAVEYCDFPMSNNNFKGKETRKRLRQSPLLSLSFGLALLVMTMIPVVNFLAIPVGVTGATALWVENLSKKK